MGNFLASQIIFAFQTFPMPLKVTGLNQLKIFVSLYIMTNQH